MSIEGKNFLLGIDPAISVISHIELLSKKIPTKEWEQLLYFIQIAVIYDLKKEIVEQTIILRQNFKIKTPDAVIAATALTQNRKLITRNSSDFKNIPDLEVIDLYNF